MSIAIPLCADTIVCTDGRTFDAIIVSESEGAVTISMEGAEITIPRADIKSVKKASSKDNASLRESWKKLDEHYKEESSRAAVEEEAQRQLTASEPAPTPLPLPEPEIDEPPTQKQIVFPAAPPPPAGAVRPQAPSREQERLKWKQDAHKAIHEKRVINGMTEEQVQSAWGFPFATAPVDNVDTHTDRWTYYQPEGRAFVYFKNGKVVSVVH